MNVCDMAGNLFTMDAHNWWIYQFARKKSMEVLIDERIDGFLQRQI